MERTIIDTNENPGCLFQILWFAFIGWWLGQVWIVVAWIMMITIAGIPIGVMMLNHLPEVVALRREPTATLVSHTAGGQWIKKKVDQPQINIILRAIYFIFVGWWFSALWMEAAYTLSLSVIGLPLGFWMFDRTPAIVSLKRG